MIDFVAKYPSILIIIVAFFSNIPLGYCRQGVKKFSLAWFFWVHASIPLIVYLRITLGVSKWLIPVSILAAIIGQLAGAQYRQRRLQNA